MTAVESLLNSALRRIGYELKRKSKVAHAPAFTMEAMLERIAGRAFNFGTIIDVGAAQGRWTQKASRFFPSARFLMVDPLEERRAGLNEVCRRILTAEVAIAAAGDRTGRVQFEVTADLDGSGVSLAASGEVPKREVPMVSLDQLVSERNLPAPFLLKLDTHGFELPILAGAFDVLRRAEALIIEAYNFRLGPECLRFHELCAHLDALGFSCSDLADPLLRPKDLLLWQMDLAFLRKSTAGFSAHHFHR